MRQGTTRLQLVVFLLLDEKVHTGEIKFMLCGKSADPRLSTDAQLARWIRSMPQVWWLRGEVGTTSQFSPTRLFMSQDLLHMLRCARALGSCCLIQSLDVPVVLQIAGARNEVQIRVSSSYVEQQVTASEPLISSCLNHTVFVATAAQPCYSLQRLSKRGVNSNKQLFCHFVLQFRFTKRIGSHLVEWTRDDKISGEKHAVEKVEKVSTRINDDRKETFDNKLLLIFLWWKTTNAFTEVNFLVSTMSSPSLTSNGERSSQVRQKSGLGKIWPRKCLRPVENREDQKRDVFANVSRVIDSQIRSDRSREGKLWDCVSRWCNALCFGSWWTDNIWQACCCKRWMKSSQCKVSRIAGFVDRLCATEKDLFASGPSLPQSRHQVTSALCQTGSKDLHDCRTYLSVIFLSRLILVLRSVDLC